MTKEKIKKLGKQLPVTFTSEPCEINLDKAIANGGKLWEKMLDSGVMKRIYFTFSVLKIKENTEATKKALKWIDIGVSHTDIMDIFNLHLSQCKCYYDFNTKLFYYKIPAFVASVEYFERLSTYGTQLNISEIFIEKLYKNILNEIKIG